MTRKRVRESLSQTLCDSCSYCEGKGFIKTPTTICYEIIRNLQRIAGNKQGFNKAITVEVHPMVYEMLFEEESTHLDEIQSLYNVDIEIKVNPKIHQEKYHINIR